MRLLFRFPRFNAKGAGLLSRIRKVIDQHSKLLENFDADGGISIRKNASGGLTFSGRGGGSSVADARSFMYHVTVTPRMVELTGEQEVDGSGDLMWNIAVNGGTAQPLFGQIQLIPAFDNSSTGLAIPDGETALVYLQYTLYDSGAYTHEFVEEIFVSTTVPTDTWDEKFYALSTISDGGAVTVGYEGAVCLVSPKSVVDVEA